MTDYELGDQIEVPTKGTEEIIEIFSRLKELEHAAETLAKSAAAQSELLWRGAREAVPDLPKDRYMDILPVEGKLIIRIGPKHSVGRADWGELFSQLKDVKDRLAGDVE